MRKKCCIILGKYGEHIVKNSEIRSHIASKCNFVPYKLFVFRHIERRISISILFRGYENTLSIKNPLNVQKLYSNEL